MLVRAWYGGGRERETKDVGVGAHARTHTYTHRQRLRHIDFSHGLATHLDFAIDADISEHAVDDLAELQASFLELQRFGIIADFGCSKRWGTNSCLPRVLKRHPDFGLKATRSMYRIISFVMH